MRVEKSTSNKSTSSSTSNNNRTANCFKKIETFAANAWNKSTARKRAKRKRMRTNWNSFVANEKQYNIWSKSNQKPKQKLIVSPVLMVLSIHFSYTTLHAWLCIMEDGDEKIEFSLAYWKWLHAMLSLCTGMIQTFIWFFLAFRWHSWRRRGIRIC